MRSSRLTISLGPSFHDHSELELLVTEDGASIAQFASPIGRLSAPLQSLAAAALMARAHDYLLQAKSEDLRGARDGIQGHLVLKTAEREVIEIEYWSPLQSDASSKLIRETLDLVSPVFPSPQVASYFEVIRTYLL